MVKLRYKKLIVIEIKNTELPEKPKISKNIPYKIRNGDNATTSVLLIICNILESDISEIVECVNNTEEQR